MQFWHFRRCLPVDIRRVPASCLAHFEGQREPRPSNRKSATCSLKRVGGRTTAKARCRGIAELATHRATDRFAAPRYVGAVVSRIRRATSHARPHICIGLCGRRWRLHSRFKLNSLTRFTPPAARGGLHTQAGHVSRVCAGPCGARLTEQRLVRTRKVRLFGFVRAMMLKIDFVDRCLAMPSGAAGASWRASRS